MTKKKTLLLLSPLAFVMLVGCPAAVIDLGCDWGCLGGTGTGAGGSGGADAGTGGSGAGTGGADAGTGGASICAPGAVASCYDGPAATEGVGICKAGTRTCAADGASWGPCAGEVLPKPEDCATPEDEDCDGTVPPCKGVLQWARRFGDANDQVGRSIATDGAGNVFITGDFAGTIDIGNALPSAGSGDVFVAKLDANGSPVWARRFGDVNNQYGAGVAVDGTGNVIVTGHFSGAVDFGGGALASAGVDDVFVVKLDPGGNYLWSKRFGGVGADFGQGVAVDSTGNVLVTGYFYGSADFGGGALTSAGGSDIFVLKLDANGNHLWSKSFGDTSDQQGISVAADGAGNVLVTGELRGSANFGGGAVTSAGAEDMFVTLMSNAGTTVWEATFGGPKSQRGGGVTFTPSGEVVASATSEEVLDLVPIGSEIPISRPPTWVGPSTIYTVKLSADGKLGGGWEMMSTAPVECAGVGYDEKAGTILAGSFKETIDYQLGAVDSRGGWDMFVARQ